ncbi:MAG: YqeG family HAD IIIA-type phosphatase [Planctomycetaceae bacterium]|jgi:HAD superfamily phosphatase (TIGR01668 family)|nr:YqeG family HAD IIIA-type phosphatase [Planctomycetaceae bacterium]
MFSFFCPDMIVEGVVDLTLARLESLGVESLLLDVDCTLKRYGSVQLLAGVSDWLVSMKEAKIGLYLVSNGGGSRIKKFAESIQIPYVAPALKPFPFAIRSVIRTMNFKKKSTAIVGDQLFTDILAGKFAAIKTILVRPHGEDEEPWFARLKRPIEKLFIKR